MEIIVDRSERIISRTDIYGNITDVNDMFEKYSEYKKEEILGKPHSIIRHSDMPRVVFRLLWVKLFHNMEINAFVKNRTKSGNFYWVYATASPIIDRVTHKTTGYISIRKAANRDAIEQIEEVYKILKDAEFQNKNDFFVSKEILRDVIAKNGIKFKELMSKMQAQGAILKL